MSGGEESQLTFILFFFSPNMLGGIKISQICEEPPSIHVVCGLRGGFINAVLTKVQFLCI